MMPQITVNRAFELPDLKNFLGDMPPFPLEDKALISAPAGANRRENEVLIISQS